MLNHNQTAIVLVIGLVAVLMTLASTRVFAQPTLPPNEENKVNNALQSEENKVNNALPTEAEREAQIRAQIKSEITADQHRIGSEVTGHAHAGQLIS
jgi:hypothetical protein